jgi:selenocysteine lyase/cysteine desulfurase
VRRTTFRLEMSSLSLGNMNVCNALYVAFYSVTAANGGPWKALASRRGVTIKYWKPRTSSVPTISFVVVGQEAMKNKDVVKVFDQKGGVSVATFRVYF